MNIAALYLSFFIVLSIILIIAGIYTYSKREIKINKFIPNSSSEKEIKKAYSKHESILSYRKRMLIIVSGGSSCGVVVYAIIGNLYISALSCLIGLLFPGLICRLIRKGQQKMVSLQMAKAAETMAAIIRSEGNIIAALERAAIDSEEPLKTRLEETANKIRLGIKTDKAFKELSKSIDVPEMVLISIGLELQQQGMAINMASMLEQIQKNIIAKQADKEELSAITAENKMAGWIVSALPFITLAVMRALSPDFINPLFTTSIGISVFIFCVAVIIVGLYWLLQIAEMDDF